MGLYSIKESFTNGSDIFNDIEESTSFEPGAHIMEYVLDIHENDHKVFESLIECDFVSALNESVMTESELRAFNEEANESKITTIKNKIVEIVEGIIRKIKELAQTLIAKVMSLFKTDEKIIKKYSEVLTKKNLEGFGGIANFSFPKTLLDKNTIQDIISFQDDISTISKINTAGSVEVIDSLVGEFKLVANKAVASDKLTKFLYFEEPRKKWVPKDTDLQIIKDVLKNSSKTIADIKSAAAMIIGGLKNSRDKAKANIKEVKSAGANKSEIEVKKALAIYSVTSETVKVYSKSWSFYTSLASMQISACRKAMLICGNYAMKKSGKTNDKKETTEVLQNSALIEWAVGESSDIFVAECLGY